MTHKARKMPHDMAEHGTVAERVTTLNARYRHHAATAVLEHALKDATLGRVALVSSFGAESVVLLHLVSVIAPETPVLFVDTRMLFPETYEYQRQLAEKLHLCDVRTIRAAQPRVNFEDPDGTLHQFNTDACCGVRKVEPLERTLSDFNGWITGRKRFQASTRQTVEFFEAEGDLRIKVNPLAHWGPEDLKDYMINNQLPRHPLVAKGYPSIGCAPCTSPVKEGEDPRAGRWRGSQKVECGIHFIDGKAVRMPTDTLTEMPIATPILPTKETAA
jgi:phosphoadenosine phosphosulfate reductase